MTNSIIDLLEQKNMHLHKFYLLNEDELENFRAGNFDSLEKFYVQREGILQIIKKLDEMIERSNDVPLDLAQIDVHVKNAIDSTLKTKNEIVKRILDQDLQILSAIEIAKSNIVKEIATVASSKQLASAYGPKGTKRNRVNEEY